jgi:phytol kinase
MLNPWLGMTLVMGLLSGLIVGLRVFQTRYQPHPEIVRKLLHVIMGLTTLTLPWVFAETWPAIALGSVAFTALFILKRSKLKKNLGQVLHGVERDSHGDLYFPISVAAVFVLANGNPLLFCLPVLILTVADATAALIGLRYGVSRYQTTEGYKSIEGSVAFFGVTFLSVLLVLLMFTEVARVDIVLIALMLGLLVMMLEAIAWLGLDNLFIPLGGFLLLKTYLTMTTPALLLNLIVILVLLSAVFLLRGRYDMDASAVMAAILTTYLIWATGGWLWLVAPLIVFVGYKWLLPDGLKGLTKLDGRPRQHNAHAVVSVAAPGLVWLLLSQSFNLVSFNITSGLRPLETSQASIFIFPYTLTFAVYLAMIGLSRVRYEGKTNDTPLIVRSVLLGWFLLFMPFLFLQGFSLRALGFSLTAVIMMMLATLTFYYVQPSFQNRLSDTPRWLWQSGIATATSCLGMMTLYFL